MATSEYRLFDSRPGEENGAPTNPKQLSNRQSVHHIVEPDDDDSSSIGEDFDVASIGSSLEDQLT